LFRPHAYLPPFDGNLRNAHARQTTKKYDLSTATIIFIGVGFYIVLMVAIGAYASGKTHTVNEFIVAGRGLPVWLCSTTIVATWFGGGTMMGASGAAYDNGMLGVIADPLGAALALFSGASVYSRSPTTWRSVMARLRPWPLQQPYFFQTSPGSAQCSSPSVSFSRP
jgi:hypothetical protein